MRASDDRRLRAPHRATHLAARRLPRGDGYATSYACARHVGYIGVRNARIAGTHNVAVVELDQPIQPVLDLGEL